MKLLNGDLNASVGEVRLNRHLRIAKFSQHFMDQLSMEETPLSFITKKVSHLNNKQLKTNESQSTDRTCNEPKNGNKNSEQTKKRTNARS